MYPRFRAVFAVLAAVVMLGASATFALASGGGTLRSEAHATVVPPKAKPKPQKKKTKVTLAQAKRACATLRAAAKPKSKIHLTKKQRAELKRRCAVAKKAAAAKKKKAGSAGR